MCVYAWLQFFKPMEKQMKEYCFHGNLTPWSSHSTVLVSAPDGQRMEDVSCVCVCVCLHNWGRRYVKKKIRVTVKTRNFGKTEARHLSHCWRAPREQMTFDSALPGVTLAPWLPPTSLAPAALVHGHWLLCDVSLGIRCLRISSTEYFSLLSGFYFSF